MEGDEKYITGVDLKQHNKEGDLWISIQGKVYNVSDWAHEHPGGDVPLLNQAGQDVTDAFIAYHPGTAWQYLDKFFTGYYLKDLKVSETSKDYRRLASEFAKLGLFEKKGHITMYALASIALMFCVVLYGVLCCQSVWAHLGSALVLGFLWIQSSYIGHDSGHYQVMKSRGYNKFAQFVSGNCLTGISMAWWKWTHNAHHLACNSLDYDPDLQHIPFFASCFYGTYLDFDPVARVNLYLQTFLLLFSKRKFPDRASNILGILIFWTWFPLLVSCLPNWPEMVMYVLASFAVTAIQHVQLCLSHFAADVYTGPPKGNDWFEKQTGGTLDISCSSWMDWFYGGLQFQLEHHLFPRMPRGQLRRVSPLVQDLCKKHNLSYRSLSFWEANVWTIRRLRNVAQQARDLSNPVPKNMLWEAVNTHG
ncbi:delta(8)-fatty-acid desaturase 2-like [Populus alba x Populus x berolinensis]|uniref:Delta(8)-fatty-acid desaturase 2-like n=1 Tax=Populus alba x Populus x berolinensis TaxID=444605 RepID=A0AAD6RFG8_9ROSI|nr:delta(8)-fatty-acid desaturase 2-like [Populus alba x Populus x berolinensis]